MRENDGSLINTRQQEVTKIRSSLSQMRQGAQEWGDKANLQRMPLSHI